MLCFADRPINDTTRDEVARQRSVRQDREFRRLDEIILDLPRAIEDGRVDPEVAEKVVRIRRG